MNINTNKELLFVATGDDTPRDNKPTIKRNAITAIVRDPINDKYLLLKWKDVNWLAFVTGGIENGQTAEGAARAEVSEETGYTDLHFVSPLPSYKAKFWHGPKGENRLAHFQCFLFKLTENSNKIEVATEETKKHNEVWLSIAELESADLQEGPHFLLNHIISKGL
ncbi:MAG: NUDIX hydrolase [Candidatus Paceibacterota bacterium]